MKMLDLAYYNELDEASKVVESVHHTSRSLHPYTFAFPVLSVFYVYFTIYLFKLGS